MPKVVPKDVEMTSPGSKMRYKVTYPNGQEKWVREQPGHKSEKWKEREKKRMLEVHPEINDFFAKLKVVVDNWVTGKADNGAIERCVREFETTAGWNKARMVMRRLKRSERVKYNKAEKGEQKDYYGKVMEALQVGVDFVARRSRDNRKKADLSSRMAMIASKLI